MAEFAAKGESREFGVAATLHDRRERVLDDAIGDPATSQFVRHSQPSIAPAQQQLLGAAPRHRFVVYISEIAQAEKGCVDDGRPEAAACELALDLRGGAGRARQHGDGGDVGALGCIVRVEHIGRPGVAVETARRSVGAAARGAVPELRSDRS